MARRVIYTDGACQKQVGGWAWASNEGLLWDAGRVDAPTTNQRMELTAAIQACKWFNIEDLEIVSDSAYVVNCWRDKWYRGWQRNGWRNSAGKDVANQDLWQLLIPHFDRIKMRWVKGHSGDPMNELVDRLAVEALKA